MKIIARLTDRYHDTTGAIVEMTSDELRTILGLEYRKEKDLGVGQQVEISNRYRHAMEVLSAANAAKKLPNALRAFADTLETVHPAIDDIVEPVIDAEFEVTP